MPPRGSVLFVDTVAIKGAHETGCWNALRNSYHLVTVEKCIEEATRQDKHRGKLIQREAGELAAELDVRPVTEVQRAALFLRTGKRSDLDDGERDLLAYALTLGREAWWLCGPDKATLKALNKLNQLDRMVALESVAQTAGHKVKGWKEQYTEKWLSLMRTKLLLGDENI